MKSKNVMLCGLLMTGLVMAACDKTNENDLNEQDETFLLKTSVSNTAEVSAGNLALSKATNPAVKAFAAHMVSEHTTAQNDLKLISNNVGFPVKDSIDPAHQAIAAQLSALSGRAFDSAYMHNQVTDHKATVTIFQAEQSNGSHREVLNFANTNLPHIQMHLVRADSITNAFFKR